MMISNQKTIYFLIRTLKLIPNNQNFRQYFEDRPIFNRIYSNEQRKLQIQIIKQMAKDIKRKSLKKIAAVVELLDKEIVYGEMPAVNFNAEREKYLFDQIKNHIEELIKKINQPDKIQPMPIKKQKIRQSVTEQLIQSINGNLQYLTTVQDMNETYSFAKNQKDTSKVIKTKYYDVFDPFLNSKDYQTQRQQIALLLNQGKHYEFRQFQCIMMQNGYFFTLDAKKYSRLLRGMCGCIFRKIQKIMKYNCRLAIIPFSCQHIYQISSSLFTKKQQIFGQKPHLFQTLLKFHRLTFNLTPVKLTSTQVIQLYITILKKKKIILTAKQNKANGNVYGYCQKNTDSLVQKLDQLADSWGKDEKYRAMFMFRQSKNLDEIVQQLKRFFPAKVGLFTRNNVKKQYDIIMYLSTCRLKKEQDFIKMDKGCFNFILQQQICKQTRKSLIDFYLTGLTDIQKMQRAIYLTNLSIHYYNNLCQNNPNGQLRKSASTNQQIKREDDGSYLIDQDFNMEIEGNVKFINEENQQDQYVNLLE